MQVLTKITLPLLITVLFSCTSNKAILYKGNYFGEESPGMIPMLFAPGFISTTNQELNAAFSPDGNEFFYTLASPGRAYYALLHTVRIDNIWSEPKVVSFSGKYSDADPLFSPDGATLYFISKRPIDGSATEKKDFDIWSVEKTEGSWGEPVHLGSNVNTDENEYYVSVTRDHSIYFSRKGDIHRAQRDKDKNAQQPYLLAEKLKGAINTSSGEGDPYVSPDERFIIFASRRKGGYGSNDLYISYKNKDGSWTDGKNLGEKINSKYFEYCPIVSPDGKYFFFTSYRPQSDFYSDKARKIEELLQRYKSNQNGLGNIFWVDSKVLSQ